MKKIIEKISKWFREKRKSNLREQCIQAYGEEFGEIYDNLNSGISVGGFVETAIVLEMIEAVKKGEPIKIKENENKKGN
jgi:hypothetical protein